MCWEERGDWLYKVYLSLSFFYKANHYAWKLFFYVNLIFLNPWHFNDLLTTSRWRTFAGWGRVSPFSVFRYALQPVFGRVASLSPAWKLGLSCPCSLRLPALPAPCVNRGKDYNWLPRVFFFFHYARAPHSLRLSYDATVPVVLMLAITPGVRKNGGQWEESEFRASESTYQQKREDMPHNLKIISELLKKLHKWLSLTYVSLEIKHIIDHHRKTFFFLLCLLPRKE